MNPGILLVDNRPTGGLTHILIKMNICYIIYSHMFLTSNIIYLREHFSMLKGVQQQMHKRSITVELPLCTERNLCPKHNMPIDCTEQRYLFLILSPNFDAL